MIILSKLADYGVIVASHLAAHPERQINAHALAAEGHKDGFFSNLEADEAPPGLSENTVRFISAKKGEPDWLLQWRLDAFRAWSKTVQPDWAKLRVAPIDYQASTYYSAPK